MKKLLFIIFIFPLLLTAQSEYFVAIGGSNGNSGTALSPWRTIAYGLTQLTAGDTLTIQPGIYYTGEIATIDPDAFPSPIGETGTPSARITIRGNPDSTAIGSWAIIDCKYHADSIPDPGWNRYNAAFSFNKVQCITMQNLEIRNVFQIDSVVNGAITYTSCANMRFENIRMHDIGQRGYWGTSGAWSEADSAYASYLAGGSPTASAPFDQPDSTFFINCDVWNVCDTFVYTPGNAGDAWKTVSYWGNYYEWNKCRAWNYSDDGFDPNGGQRRFIDCWTMSTEKYSNPDPAWDTENNGFKTTGYGDLVPLGFYSPSDSAAIVEDSLVIFERCIALFCNGYGFCTNLLSVQSTHNRYYNCWSYANGINYFLGGGGGSPWDTITDLIYNSIAYAATTNNSCAKPYNVASGSSPYLVTTSSWINNGYCNSDNSSYTNDASQYVTLDSLTLTRWFTQSRDDDGTFTPDSVPGMLDALSSFIDEGTDGYWIDSYNGTAPDIGHWEYGANYDALFYADSTTLCAEQFADFTDESTNSPSAWEWTFEGGTPGTSTDQNPRVQYAASGSFDVQLIAIGTPNDTLLVENYITVRDSIVADFSASSTSVTTGANVTFSDLTSGGDPTSWSWTFAGGTPSTSTSQNPVIQYNTAGTYTVTLESTNVCNSDTEQKVGYITVTNPYVPPSGDYKLTITFR